ncbi:MAG TPA: hypothetical protein VK509_24890 [Polyangiales bacterium]|nr:hypothetical protein [Polyangiales bacterium]
MSIAERQYADARALVLTVIDLQLHGYRGLVHKCRRRATEAAREGNTPMMDAHRAIADTYDQCIVALQRTRDRYAVAESEAELAR